MAIKKADVAPLVGDHTTPADPEVETPTETETPTEPEAPTEPAEPAVEAPTVEEVDANAHNRAKGKRPRISEGMRHDIEVVGWAVDPSTGIKVTKDDLRQSQGR